MNVVPTISFRPARLTDLSLMFDILERNMTGYFLATWNVWNSGFQRSRFEQNFAAEQSQLILADGEPIGFLVCDHGPDVVFIHNIQIASDWQRRGIGGQILRQLLDDARDRRLKVQLEVLKANPSQRLYERLGFRIIDDEETHYVMQFDP